MKFNKKTVIWSLVALIIVSGVGFLGYKAYEYHEAKTLVEVYSKKSFPNIYVNGVDVSMKSRSEVQAVIEGEIESFENRKIVISIDDKEYTYTLKDFGPTFNASGYELAKEIVAIGHDLSILEQASSIREPIRYDFDITYEYTTSLVDEMTQTLEREAYIEKVEPKFSMVSYGEFSVEEGADGYSLNGEWLSNELQDKLNVKSKDGINIVVERVVVPREEDASLLKSVNSLISTYSSHYDPNIARAINVELAAKKIDKVLLMPGDEFSYAAQVEPVDFEHGYVDATIFSNGKAVPGVGGGICQISSTLYNTQLEAGILATERRNHSLPVGYVPLGQDATYAENYIDYRFVNTLDYPIYINVLVGSGNLTIEFWSNEDALKGITYKPKTIASADRLRGDTTLYGYDSEGNVVYEKFLHTSKYKPYQ
ncbi:MAG: VanW family protein [Turicibacter sp.]